MRTESDVLSTKWLASPIAGHLDVNGADLHAELGRFPVEVIAEASAYRKRLSQNGSFEWTRASACWLRISGFI